MENEKWRDALKENLGKLRRQASLTQTELGEKLNYSDKSVSKWERGEGIPDLSVLIKLKELYGVSLDELLGLAPASSPKHTLRHATVLLLEAGVILMCALIAFAAMTVFAPGFHKSYLVFVFALPLIFLCLGISFIRWKKRPWSLGCLSLFIWTTCLTVNLSFSVLNAGLIYTIGGILQLTALIVIGFMILKAGRNPGIK